MKAVIDRIEGNLAVVLFGDSEIKVDLPRELLPAGAGEGDILNVSFDLDEDSTRDRREKIEDLLKKLKEKNNRRE